MLWQVFEQVKDIHDFQINIGQHQGSTLAKILSFCLVMDEVTRDILSSSPNISHVLLFILTLTIYFIKKI
jgi:hypothetical protein